MTAAHAGRAPLRAPPELPRIRLSWAMAAVLLTAALATGGAVAEHATLEDRVAHLEKDVPPGAWQVMDERTKRMQADLDHLVGRSPR